jgi:hypothetical protein
MSLFVMHPVPPRSSASSPSSIAASATRVHPSDAGDAVAVAHHHDGSGGRRGRATDGFSVYDAAGSLAFRVDNYSRRRKLFAGELLLMDGRGAPLLALRPQVRTLRSG